MRLALFNLALKLHFYYIKDNSPVRGAHLGRTLQMCNKIADTLNYLKPPAIYHPLYYSFECSPYRNFISNALNQYGSSIFFMTFTNLRDRIQLYANALLVMHRGVKRKEKLQGFNSFKFICHYQIFKRTQGHVYFMYGEFVIATSFHLTPFLGQRVTYMYNIFLILSL